MVMDLLLKCVFFFLWDNHLEIMGLYIPSGKLLHNELERSTMLLMGKSTISMAIFNSKLLIYQRVMVLMDLLTGAVLNAGNFQGRIPVITGN